MNRRNVIKTLGLSAVGLATVPLWMDGWSAEDLPSVDSILNDKQSLVLSELVGIIIPATETPGAKELEVDKFVVTMVTDCYEKETRKEFLAGFAALNTNAEEKYGNNFMDLNKEEKTTLALELLNQEPGEQPEFNFVSFVKALTIAGYMNSKYIMTEVTKYEFVPSRFNGSFPVKQTSTNKV